MTAAWNSKNDTRQVVVIVNSNLDQDAPVSQARARSSQRRTAAARSEGGPANRVVAGEMVAA
jgi:hypothetical protein